MPSTTGFFTPPEHYTFGYVQSWNLSLEKDLGAGFIGQAGYVGTRQIKQLQALDLNVQRVGGGRNSQPLFQQFGRTGSMNLLTNYGHSYYDSLQASLKRSFAQGFQFNLAYTYSKAIGMCCDDLSDKRPAIQIPEFLDLNKALAPFDRPHVLSMATVLELPFGDGKRWANSGGLGAAIAGGWQINALFTAYSGRPFSVSAAGGSLNAANNNQRADQIKPEVAMLGGTGPNQSWFDPLAFAPVTEARFGTAGFNTVRGPNAVNLDFGIVRNFQMGERFALQFRGEALNLTNTPHFNNPASNVSNLQLNPDGTIRNLGGFTTISSTTGTGREGIDERVFRFGMRLRF
jgi:hypothetical protein